MISIGTNDFANIMESLENFEERLSAMPPTLFSIYTETISQEERGDENKYI